MIALLAGSQCVVIYPIKVQTYLVMVSWQGSNNGRDGVTQRGRQPPLSRSSNTKDGDGGKGGLIKTINRFSPVLI